MKSTLSRFTLSSSLVVLLSAVGLADDPPPIPFTGAALGSYSSGTFDTVNLANLNVHFEIPVFQKAGKGQPFSYILAFNSLVWVTASSSLYQFGVWTPKGWGLSGGALGSVTCRQYQGNCNDSDSFAYIEPNGSTHPFPFWGGGQQNSTDNSGYRIIAYDSGTRLATVVTRSGVTLKVHVKVNAAPPPSPYSDGEPAGVSSVDPNGNTIGVDSSGYYDSTGAHVLTEVLGYDGSDSLTYTAPSGAQATVKITSLVHTIQTNFKVCYTDQYHQRDCIAEYPGLDESPSASLVDKITMPDGTYYQFTYEQTDGYPVGTTTGRLASVRLPTGNQITYSYAGTGCYDSNNCMMHDGAPSAMTRTVGGHTWRYTRGMQAGYRDWGGAPMQTTTTIIDPAGNETDMDFSGGSLYDGPQPQYETMRTVYQGPASQGHVLDYSYTCYNGNHNESTCPTAIINDYSGTGIWWTARADHPDTVSFTSLASSLWSFYDPLGNLTEEDTYDYGFPGNHKLLRSVVTGYDTPLCTSPNYVCDRPVTSQIFDSAHTQLARTDYYYDGGYDTKGNLTTVSRWVRGTAALSRQYSYNTGAGQGGTLASATDWNGAVTTYTYDPNVCGGAFPTSMTEPSQFVGSLTASYGYNCTGGVLTSTTDPNGATVSTSYYDPYFWRPSSTTDAVGTRTYYNYYGVTNFPEGSVMGIGQAEVGMWWNNGFSIADTVTTHDGLGRVSLTQTRQAPRGQPHGDSFDTVETDYDGSGNVSQVSQPFTCGLGQGLAHCSAPVTTTTYDALNRALVETDPAGRTTTYDYALNDVQIMVAGGQSFRKQIEKDALGRLESVCEMSTSLGGVGDCGQQRHLTGYLTSYQHDAVGNLTGVTQATQTRSFTYDGLSRLTSETNPENVTTGYAYDFDPLGICLGTYLGDKVRRTDVLNNNTCYAWDGLHRLTAAMYSGPASTQNKYYWYDMHPDGAAAFTATNPLGRLVFTFTCCLSGGVDSSWSGFGYDKRGTTTDFYEAGSYGPGPYHTVNAIAPTGAVASRSGYLWDGTAGRNIGLFTNTFAYSFDGEGRPNALTDQTTGEQIWVPGSTTYNPAGEPTQLVFYPSGDREQFTWDPNTGRLANWQSTLSSGADTQSGALTWNPNGTLARLQIQDQANHANNQTCNYGYDDLARLASVDCGARIWQQNFSYDQWGNITKSVPQGSQGTSFPATYNVFTNRFENLVNEGIVTYDGNGDVTKDSQSNRFTYDAEGRQVTVNTYATVFDAFNRAVAIQNPSGYHQVVYAPDGYKLAIMNGQTVVKYTVPLAAGVQAVYTGNSPARVAYFRHSDWLGSSRLASTRASELYYDGAYAPFGESYAETGTWDRSFTGQQTDTNFELYDFPLRQQASVEGRWLVPDPAGLVAVDLANPQTWNRYAYAGNNPLVNEDSLGLDDGSGDDGCEWCDQFPSDWYYPPIDVNLFFFGDSSSLTSFFTSQSGFDFQGWPSELAYNTFGTPSAGTWASASFVANTFAVATIGVVGGVFAGAEIGAGSLGLYGPAANRAFWTGAQAIERGILPSSAWKATQWAMSTEGTTLEMTPAGRTLSFLGDWAPDSWWEYASEKYAQGAEGPVMFFEGPTVRLGNTWMKESRVLTGKGNPIHNVPVGWPGPR